MAIFLPIVPNWQNGVRDTYEFKTSVFTSRDGSEQRRSERIQPRRTITAAALLDGDRQRTFADAVNTAKDGKVLISDFSGEPAILQETVSTGETVLTLDHIPSWMSGGINCALLTGRKARKIGIASVSPVVNLLSYPNDFGNAYWTKNGATVSGDTAVAPDGTSTMDKLVDSTANSTHSVSKTISYIAGTRYTFSVYAKAAERSRILLQMPISGVYGYGRFDLAAETATAINGQDAVATIESVGSGIYRCSLTVTATETLTKTFAVVLMDNSNATTFTGTGSSGLFLWGADLRVDANRITLTTALTDAVGQGAQLFPLIPASLAPSSTLSVYTNLISTTSLTLAVEPGTVVRTPDPLPFDGEPESETTQVFGPAALFYGRYVLLRKPNYLQRPTLAFNVPYQTVDYDRGVTKTFTPVPIISRTLTATYLAVSHADALAILDVFMRTKGRAGEIFVPTWGSDLPPIVAVGTSTLIVEGTDFYDAYTNNGVLDLAHKTVVIRTTDGQLKPFEITGLSVSGGNTTITFDAPLELTKSQIDIISWMFVARFASDALTIDWRTNGVANIALSFTTLANLAAEDSFGNNWILATGYWRDGGVWQDGSAWID